MESLLRAYVSRPTNRVCSEFDADLANAYIERNLTTASRSHYEQHLSECAPCRKNVIALSRLAESELQPSISARASAAVGPRRFFGVTSWPRWAMAAAAVIVIAISLPLLLTSNDSHRAGDAALATNASPAVENSPAGSESQERTSSTAAKVAAASPAANADANTEPKPSERQRTDTVSSNGPAPTQRSGDKASLNGKLEAKPESAPVIDQVQVASGARPVSEGAERQRQGERKAQGETDQARSQSVRQQQPSKDAAADTRTSGNEDSTKKEQVAESAAAIPPPAPPSAKSNNKSDSKSDKLKRPSSMRALRDSSSTEAVRLTERRVGNKRFLLKNDTWTDRSFKPDQDLPVVTVIRDSNVYNELLSKQAGLRTYLGGFTGSERAIIVYNGTVYKLIPQQSDN